MFGGRACLALLLLCGSSACLVSIDYGGGPFLCVEEPVCDDGFECVEGQCVPEGSVDAGVDAAPDALLAPSLPPFGAPQLVAELADMVDGADDASFSADRLVVVFNSDRGGTSDLWISERGSIGEPWSAPAVLAPVSSVDTETTIALSPDGLTVMFGSDRAGGVGDVDIWVSTRPSRSGAWAAATNVPSLSSIGGDYASWISNGGASIIIHSDRGGDLDLYTADLDPNTGEYSAPAPISEINTADAENSGRFAAGGLVLTFHSNRVDGLGRADIYVATRATVSEPFGAPRPFAELNTVNTDEDAWLSDDLCYVAYATRDANDVQQIHEATCVP